MLLLLVLLLLRTRASSFRALVRKPLLSSPFAAAVEDVARCRRTAANSRRENSSETFWSSPVVSGAGVFRWCPTAKRLE